VTGGQLVDERFQLGLELLPVLCVERDVGDHASAGDEPVAHPGEPGQHAVPILIHALGQRAQEEKLAHAAHLLAGPVGLAERRAQPRVDEQMAAGHQAALQSRFVLQHDLPEAFTVVEPGAQQHVAQDVEQVVELGEGALAAQEEAPDRLAALAHECVQRAGLNAARLAPDALKQLDEVFLVRAHLQQSATHQPCIGHILGWQDAQVEAEVEINDAVGEQVVIQDGRAVIRRSVHLDGDRLVLLVEVVQLQGRNRRQSFGGIGCQLHLPERVRLADDALKVVGAHLRAGLLQPGALVRFHLLAHLRVGRQDDGGAMRVVEKVLPDQAGKDVFAAAQAIFDGLERPFEGEPRERIATIQPRLQCCRHEDDAAWEAAEVALAQAEFDGVDRSLDLVRVEAALGKVVQCVEYQSLQLVGVGGIHALQADREGGLAQLVVVAAAGEILSQAAVNERLAQG